MNTPIASLPVDPCAAPTDSGCPMQGPLFLRGKKSFHPLKLQQNKATHTLPSLVEFVYIYFYFLNRMYVYACLSVATRVWVQVGIQKIVSDPLKLELQAVRSHLTWRVGTELWSSGRAGSALNL